MTNFSHLGSVTLLLCFLPISGVAEEVTTTSLETGIPVTGELLSFDEEFLVIDTSFGPLKILRSSVSCAGDACPTAIASSETANAAPTPDPVEQPASSADAYLIDLNVAAAPEHVTTVMTGLLRGYASKHELITLNYPAPAGGLMRVDFVEPNDLGNAFGTVDFVSLGSSDALASLNSDRSHLVLTETPATPGTDVRPIEIETSAVAVIDVDALVPVVHPNNTVNEISIDNVSKLMTGEIKNWSDLGGPDLPIKLLLPEIDSALDDLLNSAVPLSVDAATLANATRATPDAPALASVMSDTSAISFVHFSEVGVARSLPLIDACDNRHVASTYSIRTEEYPLSTRVYAGAQGSHAMDLLTYAVSDAGQQNLQAMGKVGQIIETKPLLGQNVRLNSALDEDTALTRILSQSFVDLVSEAERLTTTFRFEEGTSTPDAKTASDMDRLVAYLSLPQMASKQVMIIGFGDNSGSFDEVAQRANDDANTILEMLQNVSTQVLPQDVTTFGFGLLSPVACNQTASGRHTNRRVEIWIK